MIVGNKRKRIKLQGEEEEEILFFVEEQAKRAMIISYEEYTELTQSNILRG